MTSSADHWDDIYGNRDIDKLGWYEQRPDTSLELIRSIVKLPLQTKLLDVGGGTSTLVDYLINDGYQSIAVLDISAEGLHIAKRRLGERADKVKWILGDITAQTNLSTFDVWHDRAVFHFITDDDKRKKYAEIASNTVPVEGHLIIGTFALDGVPKCSGLPVCRYDSYGLSQIFEPAFKMVESRRHVHITPSGSTRPFTFVVLRRR